MDSAVEIWLRENGFDPGRPLDSNPAGHASLILAAQQNRADVLRYLVGQGADLSVLDAYGNNTLWAACFANSADCIAVLLTAGVAIDYQNATGATALIYAASSGKDLVVSQLLQAGANPLLTTQDDFSALDLAATFDCLKMLRQAVKLCGYKKTNSS